jgi:hypothetical protein
MLIEGVEYTENTKDTNNKVPSDENDFDTGGDSVTEGSRVTTGCTGLGSRNKGQKLDHG